MPETGTELLSRLEAEPVFVLTSDQDWAPGWASKVLLDIAAEYEVPLHVFRTNTCPVLDASLRLGSSSNGWHPNFDLGSTHGSNVREVVQHMRTTFPSGRSFRSHRFSESSEACRELRRAGVIADSQFATLMAKAIRPLRHWTGIVRLPVFFEDDVFFECWPEELPLAAISQRLFSPGLKVLNFHPTFVGCNTPSRTFYDSTREKVFGSLEPAKGVIWQGFGTCDVLRWMLEQIRSGGVEFEKFDEIAALADLGLENPIATLWTANDVEEVR